MLPWYCWISTDCSLRAGCVAVTCTGPSHLLFSWKWCYECNVLWAAWCSPHAEGRVTPGHKSYWGVVVITQTSSRGRQKLRTAALNPDIFQLSLSFFWKCLTYGADWLSSLISGESKLICPCSMKRSIFPFLFLEYSTKSSITRVSAGVARRRLWRIFWATTKWNRLMFEYHHNLHI